MEELCIPSQDFLQDSCKILNFFITRVRTHEGMMGGGGGLSVLFILFHEIANQAVSW